MPAMASLQCGQKKLRYARRKTERKLTVATWNVCTLIDVQGADRPKKINTLIKRELHRYKMYILAFSEKRLVDTGSLEEAGSGYTVFWSGLPAAERLIHGVGFTVCTALIRQFSELLICHSEMADYITDSISSSILCHYGIRVRSYTRRRWRNEGLILLTSSRSVANDPCWWQGGVDGQP